MKKVIIFLVFLNFLFAKTNINQADRYELMILGELDAGRADMLINYRKKNEITNISQLKMIVGFAGYNTQKLAENFEFKPLEKDEKTDKKKDQKKAENDNVVVVEKTKIVNQPYTYQRVQRYGDIEIIDTYNVPNRNHRPYIKRPNPAHDMRFQNRVKPMQNKNNDYQKKDGISIDGNINLKIEKNYSQLLGLKV